MNALDIDSYAMVSIPEVQTVAALRGKKSALIRLAAGPIMPLIRQAAAMDWIPGSAFSGLGTFPLLTLHAAT